MKRYYRGGVSTSMAMYRVAAAVVALALLFARGAHAAAPADLSNFQGNYGCSSGVQLARVADVSSSSESSQGGQLAAVQSAVARATRVKATGLGHSWWGDNFCAGSEPDAVNVMLRREPAHAPAGAGGDGGEEEGPPPLKAVIVDGEDTASGFSAANTGSSGSTPLTLDGGDVLVNPTARTVTSPAGVTTRELLDLLASVAPAPGWTLPTFPWFIDQTIGGAVATGSHGSSLSHGSLSSKDVLLAMTAVLANGTVAQLSPERTPGLWRAFAVSAGRLGVIVDVTLRIVSNAMTRRDVAVMSTRAMLAEIAELQADARATAAAAADGGGSGDDTGLSPEMFSTWNERNYLWFMTRAPEAKNGAWRADVSPYNKTGSNVNASAVAAEWTEREAKFRKANEDPKYMMPRIFAGITGASWKTEQQKRDSQRADFAANFSSASTAQNDEVEYDPQPDAGQLDRRGIISPQTGALSTGFSSALMGMGTREQAEVTATLLLDEFYPQISPKRAALVHQRAAMSAGAPDLMPYDQYEVAVPLVNASDCLNLVAAQLFDNPKRPKGDADMSAPRWQLQGTSLDHPSWEAMRAPALIRFVAAEPENFLSPSWDGPKMYVNIEDYVKYIMVSRVSPGFDAVMAVLQGDTCQGRLHWGKAGRRGKHDGGEEGESDGAYGEGWCHFGCAALAVDPSGKFRGQWGGWNAWVPDALQRCCVPGDAEFKFDAGGGCGGCTRREVTSKSN